MLVACFAIGMALRQWNRVPENAHLSINGFIIHVSLPALTLLQIHSVVLNPALLYAVLMPWLLFAGSTVLFLLVGRALRLPRNTIGALIVVGGLGNTSFIGLPMIEAFYGPGGLPTGIIIDQLGSYLVLSTAGIVLIASFSQGAISAREIGRRILTFPPLLALVLALALIPYDYPSWAVSVLTRLATTLAPLALVSVGMQFRLGALAGNRTPLALGLSYKLVLGPVLILLLYAGALGLRGGVAQVTLFEAGMAPMIGGSIVAIQYGLNPPLVSLTVGVGTVLSFLTLPVWWLSFSALGLG